MEETPEEDERYEAEQRARQEEFEKMQKMIDLSEEEERQNSSRVTVALAKFNFFIHVTGWLSGCAYLVILGILIPRAFPYLVIPIAIWTCLLLVHALYAFWPTGPVNRLLRRAFGLKRKSKSPPPSPADSQFDDGEGEQPREEDPDSGVEGLPAAR